MKRAAYRLPPPTESAEQKALMEWAEIQSGKYPELDLLYHVPNGGSRRKAEAGRLRAEGVKSGVPDLCLPVARGGYHGLYVEMKRIEGGKVSENQATWLRRLAEEGYASYLCEGKAAAIRVIMDYLKKGR